MHGDHADLLLRPFLNRFIGELDGHLSRSLNHDGSSHDLPIGVDAEVGRKTVKIRLPAGRAFKGSLEKRACLGIIGHSGLCISSGSMFHRGLLCVVAGLKNNYSDLDRSSTTVGTIELFRTPLFMAVNISLICSRFV